MCFRSRRPRAALLARDDARRLRRRQLGRGPAHDAAAVRRPGRARPSSSRARTGSRRRWVRAEVTIVALRDRHLVGAERAGALRRAEHRRASATPTAGSRCVDREPRARRDATPSGALVRTHAGAARALEAATYPTARLPESTPRVYVAAVRRAPAATRPCRGPLAARAPASYAYRPSTSAAQRIVGRREDPVRGGRRARVLAPRQRPASATTSIRRRPGASRRSSSFVTETKRGYCQHFAGAMALMLRYLGIPARVAAGFASGHVRPGTAATGSYRPRRAHLGRGLVPTAGAGCRSTRRPGGQLAAPYSASSESFDAGQLRPRWSAPDTAIQRLLRNEALTARACAASTRAPCRSRPSSNVTARCCIVGLVLLARSVLAVGRCRGQGASRRRARYRLGDPRAVAAACRARARASSCSTSGIDVPRSATPAGARRAPRPQLEVDASRLVDAARRRALRRRPERAAGRPRARAESSRAPARPAAAARRVRAAAAARSRSARSAAREPVAVVMAAGLGTRLRPLTERWAEAGAADRRPAGARDAAARARRRRLRPVRRRHRPPGRAGRGAARRPPSVATPVRRTQPGGDRLGRRGPCAARAPSRRSSSPPRTRSTAAAIRARFWRRFEQSGAAGAIAMRRQPGRPVGHAAIRAEDGRVVRVVDPRTSPLHGRAAVAVGPADRGAARRRPARAAVRARDAFQAAIDAGEVSGDRDREDARLDVSA